MTTTSTGVSMDLDTKPAAMGDAVYGRLLKERIIWLGGPVTDESANQICAQMLLLAAEDPEKPIYLYINSPGGSVTAGMAIYDTMQLLPSLWASQPPWASSSSPRAPLANALQPRTRVSSCTSPPVAWAVQQRTSALMPTSS